MTPTWAHRTTRCSIHTALKGETMPDYYEILQISPDASPEEINRAWYRVVRNYRRSTATPEAVQHKQAVDEAYEILYDPIKRQAYDAERSAAVQRLCPTCGRPADRPDSDWCN